MIINFQTFSFSNGSLSPLKPWKFGKKGVSIHNHRNVQDQEHTVHNNIIHGEGG